MVIKLKGKTVMLIAAGVGMCATVWLTARNTPEAQKRKEEALKEKRERVGDDTAQLTFFESVKAQIGAYIPAIVSGMFTVGSLVGSEVINEANLKKAEKALDDYRDMTEKLDGKGARKALEKAVEQKRADEKAGKSWEKKEMYRIVFQGHSIQFESTRAEVMEAIYETNRAFHGLGIVSFNDFLKNLGQEPVEEGDERGWESYVGEAVYGYTWIDFGLKESEDEPWITEIYMACYPHFFDEDEATAEIDSDLQKLIAASEKGGSAS